MAVVVLSADISELQSARDTQVGQEPGQVDKVADGLLVAIGQQAKMIQLEC